MTHKLLEKPAAHSMAHHLVTYAANNMIAPLVHAQIARDEYEELERKVIKMQRAIDTMDACLSEAVSERDEAVALLQRTFGDTKEGDPQFPAWDSLKRDARAFLSSLSTDGKGRA